MNNKIKLYKATIKVKLLVIAVEMGMKNPSKMIAIKLLIEKN